MTGEWESAVSAKQVDSVQEETLAVSAAGLTVDIKHNRPRLLQKQRHRLTEENTRKVVVPGEKVLLEGKVRKRAKKSTKELVRIRRVIIGILSYVKIANLHRDANSATKCLFRYTEAEGQPSKKSNKSGGTLKESTLPPET